MRITARKRSEGASCGTASPEGTDRAWRIDDYARTRGRSHRARSCPDERARSYWQPHPSRPVTQRPGANRVAALDAVRLLDLGEALGNCASVFVDFARTHSSTLLPGYTHMRRAMPSSWGMWGVAFAEGLLEELEQLPVLWSRIDKCPLGAAAGFGVPLKLNRERAAELLGFSRVQRSPIDVMNSRGRHEQAITAWIVSAAGS